MNVLNHGIISNTLIPYNLGYNMRKQIILSFSEEENVIINARSKLDKLESLVYHRSVEGDEILMTSKDKAVMQIFEVYDNITVINSVLRKLEHYKKQMRKVKIIDGTVINNKINHITNQANKSIGEWKKVKFIGKFSKETGVVYTGFRGVAWYDQPLRNFLDMVVGTVYVVRGESVKVDSMKNLLHILNTVYYDVTTITDEDNYEYHIPRNALIGIIQQLLLIESRPVDSNNELGFKLRVARKASRDRAMYKISNDFQISSTVLTNVLNDYDLMNYSQNKVMDSVGIEFMKNELPTWVKNTLQVPKTNNTTKVQQKDYMAEMKKLKKLFLKYSYGKKANMKDTTQDKLFNDNLTKYHDNQHTSITQLNTTSYDKAYNVVRSQIG